MQEVQHLDGSMAPVEDMDFSDDEGLEDLDNIDEESDIKEEERSPESHLPSSTHGHVQSAAGLSGSKDDVLTARQLRIALFALCDGLRQAARVFSTDVQLIRSWLTEARTRLKQSEQEQKDHAEGQNRMVAWVLSMREQQLPISESSLFHKASTLKKKGSFSDSFRISYDWAVSFMLQHQLGARSLGGDARLSRRLPLSLEAKIQSFREFTQKVIQVNKLPGGTVAAMDELCLFVDLRLVQDKSRRSEALDLTGSLPLVTVYLTVLSEGVMLPSLVVSNRQLAEKTLPEFVLLQAGADTLTVEEALDLWTNKVWLQRASSPAQPSKSVLVLDRHREHLGDTFLTSISGSGTLPAVIPGGCSFRLQPLEICLKPVLQRFLLSRWTKFTAGNPKELEETSPLRLQANVAQLLVDWTVEALTHMNQLSELWKKSFHLTKLLPKQKEEEEEEVEKMAGQKQEEIRSDLVKTLTEILLGPEALEEESLELLEDEEEQGGGEDRQEDKDVEEGKGDSKDRVEEGKETKEEGKETKEGGRLQDADEEGQETIKGKVTDNRSEDTRKLEEEEKETGEDRSKEMKKPMEDSKEGGNETEQGKETGEDNKEQGEETGDSKEEMKKLEEDSEEEGKETEEDRKEASKERRETRIVIGEEVGDEWKITVKSRTESVEEDS